MRSRGAKRLERSMDVLLESKRRSGMKRRAGRRPRWYEKQNRKKAKAWYDKEGREKANENYEAEEKGEGQRLV